MDTNSSRRIKRGGGGQKPVADTPVDSHEGRTFLFFLACSLIVHVVIFGSFWLLQKPGKIHKSIELINVSVTSLPGPAGGGGDSEEIKPPTKEKKKEEIPEKEQVKVASKLVEKKQPEPNKKPEAEAQKVAQTAPKGPGVGPVGGGKIIEDAVQGPIPTDGENSPVLSSYLNRLKGKVDRDWKAPAILTKIPPKTVVSFRISRRGRISDIILEKSSGNIVLDNSALGMIRTIRDLGPLPAGYNGDSLGIHYTFIAENK